MRSDPGDRDPDDAPAEIHNGPPALEGTERHGALDHRGKVVCPIVVPGITRLRCQREQQINHLSGPFEADRHDVPCPSVISRFEHVGFGQDSAAVDAIQKIVLSNAG